MSSHESLYSAASGAGKPLGCHTCTLLQPSRCGCHGCRSLNWVLLRAALEHIARLPYLRATLAESLRLYPQPPILIRRALADDVLPPGLRGVPGGYPIGKGADLFISVWNLHRSVTLSRLLKALGYLDCDRTTGQADCAPIQQFP